MNFKLKRSPASRAERDLCLALPAGELLSLKSHTKERKKDMILTKDIFIFMQKGTTFINTCCFSFDLELTLTCTVYTHMCKIFR